LDISGLYTNAYGKLLGHLAVAGQIRKSRFVCIRQVIRNLTNKTTIKKEFNFVFCQKGAEWAMSSNIQFINFLMYDHTSVAIEAKTNAFAEQPNTAYAATFYNETYGCAILNSKIIGNSTSSTTDDSITQSGLVLPWDRGTLIKNVKFYNFPNSSSHAIRSTEIRGRCELVFNK